MRNPFRRQPPEGAHGRRNIDGSYFTIWQCERGHGAVGEHDSPPDSFCRTCYAASMLPPDSTIWARCTTEEARRFLFELEGFSMYDGVGFSLVDA